MDEYLKEQGVEIRFPTSPLHNLKIRTSCFSEGRFINS